MTLANFRDSELIAAFQEFKNQTRAAASLGIPRTTFQRHLKAAQGNVERRSRPIMVNPYYLRVRSRLHCNSKRVLAIGDCHDSSHMPDKTRFLKMGSFAAEQMVDEIVQIGDFTSLDSMSAHEANDTVKGQAKPSFSQDMESLHRALEAFTEGLGGYECQKHITLGNHEERLFSFENKIPEIGTILNETIFKSLKDHAWTFSPYGAFYFVGDVGFTHAPKNIMGKPYGGVHCENAIARDALHDVVFGHTHKRTDKGFPKIGNETVTIINLGTSLPDGHVEQYAKHSLTGWAYGVYLLDIKDGRLSQRTWVPISDLMD